MERIKSKDKHPFFRAYSVVQEGISRPKVLKENAPNPIFWIKNIVLKAGKKIKKGLQFFNGHNEDNSTNDRPELGRVVGRIVKKIDNKISQIVIGYFPDRSKIEDLDICSIEAEVAVQENGEMDIARGVQNISGIALANSKIEKPGFAGAMKLASLQCFEGNSKTKDILDKDVNKGDKKMTYEEWLAAASFDWHARAVKEKRIFPSQLGYSLKDLEQDREFSEHFDSFNKLKKDNEQLSTDLKNEKDGREKDMIDNQKITAGKRLEELLPEGLTKKQKAYILGTFDPEKVSDLTEEGLKGYLETAKEDYKKVAEVFGEKLKEDDNSNENKPSSEGDFSTSDENDVQNTVLGDILEEEE